MAIIDLIISNIIVVVIICTSINSLCYCSDQWQRSALKTSDSTLVASIVIFILIFLIIVIFTFIIFILVLFAVHLCIDSARYQQRITIGIVQLALKFWRKQ
jgi:uncharacterized membrane protein YidH (DUF202 family)